MGVRPSSEILDDVDRSRHSRATPACRHSSEPLNAALTSLWLKTLEEWRLCRPHEAIGSSPTASARNKYLVKWGQASSAGRSDRRH